MTTPTADQLAIAMGTLIGLGLKSADRNVLRHVQDGDVHRYYWPERTAEGITYAPVHVDVDRAAGGTVRGTVAYFAELHLIVLAEERYGATDALAGGKYESSPWSITAAGEAALRAGDRP